MFLKKLCSCSTSKSPQKLSVGVHDLRNGGDADANKLGTPMTAVSVDTQASPGAKLVIEIFHDGENCSLRRNANGSRLYDLTVRSILHAWLGNDFDPDMEHNCTVNWRLLYPISYKNKVETHGVDDDVANVQLPRVVLRDLQTRGVMHINPGEKEGAVDVTLKELMEKTRHMHTEDTDEQKSRRLIVLISGDRDFASDMRAFRQAGFLIMLIHDPKKTAASFMDMFQRECKRINWESLLNMSCKVDSSISLISDAETSNVLTPRSGISVTTSNAEKPGSVVSEAKSLSSAAVLTLQNDPSIDEIRGSGDPATPRSQISLKYSPRNVARRLFGDKSDLPSTKRKSDLLTRVGTESPRPLSTQQSMSPRPAATPKKNMSTLSPFARDLYLFLSKEKSSGHKLGPSQETMFISAYPQYSKLVGRDELHEMIKSKASCGLFEWSSKTKKNKRFVRIRDAAFIEQFSEAIKKGSLTKVSASMTGPKSNVRTILKILFVICTLIAMGAALFAIYKYVVSTGLPKIPTSKIHVEEVSSKRIKFKFGAQQIEPRPVSKRGYVGYIRSENVLVDKVIGLITKLLART